jgi:hypothetical protein
VIATLQRAETGGAKQAEMSALQLGQFIAADTSIRTGSVTVCSEIMRFTRRRSRLLRRNLLTPPERANASHVEYCR